MRVTVISTSMKLIISAGLLAGMNLASGMQPDQTGKKDIFKVMQVNEVAFHSQKSYKNPYMDVDLWVDLNGPDGLSYRIPAFWDGGQVFRVRLVATKQGVWNWSTGARTGDGGLDNQSGSFKASAWTEAEKEENPNRRGFIRLSPNRRTFEYADGTPFFFTIDTRWCALTGIYAWGSDSGMSGMSFQDVIDRRKAQGFNSIGIVACYPSDTLAGIWTPTDGAKVAEDGSTPFVITNPADNKFGVDYTQINPAYWQQTDRKMKYMSDNGFAPFFETVRKHELWYQENQAEQDAFVNFTRYLWARYGCYNMLYTWIHTDSGHAVALRWEKLINNALDALGDMPYDQPRTIMGNPDCVDTWLRTPEPVVPFEVFDLYNVSNRYRDYRMFAGLRGIALKTNPYMNENSPTMPGANLEGFYPGYFNNLVEREFDGPYTGKAIDETDLGRKQMSQFMMYGSVLNGGFGGHAWGDCYYPGVSSQTQQSGNKPPTETDGEPNVDGFDKWGVATMGHLKTFVLNSNHDFRTLRPATMTHQVDTEREFRVLALNEDKSVGLGFIAANHTKTDLIKLIPNAKYTFEWYNIDTGVWSQSSTLRSDATGKLVLPNKPNTNGWAFRIKHNDEQNVQG